MKTVLDKILHYKKIWVMERKKILSEKKLIAMLKTQTRKIEGRDFEASLLNARKNNESAFILECKKASPSLGVIRKDFNVAKIATVYSKHASAISVLSDEKYFSGSFDFLKIAKDNSTCPILCKDFFIDTYQVYLAKYKGADAILLMLSALDDVRYALLEKLATSLKMGVLTEISNEDEAVRAKQLGARIIGINNRNLRDLTTNLERTKQLGKLFSNDDFIISESGIKNFSDVIHLKNSCSGFLVGSNIMKQDDVEMAVKSLKFGQNKVCGIMTNETAKIVEREGAIFGGIIFAKSSKRFVDYLKANEITKNVNLKFVGVFQNNTIEFIIKVALKVNLYAVQLHGSEGQEFIAELKDKLSNIKIFKVIKIDINAKSFPKTIPSADFYVLDCMMDGESGGLSKMFNWNLIPHKIKSKSLLAGGIGTKEINEAIKVGCMGLDMNSKLEMDGDTPVKSESKVKLAFEKIKKCRA